MWFHEAAVGTNFVIIGAILNRHHSLSMDLCVLLVEFLPAILGYLLNSLKLIVLKILKTVILLIRGWTSLCSVPITIVLRTRFQSKRSQILNHRILITFLLPRFTACLTIQVFHPLRFLVIYRENTLISKMWLHLLQRSHKFPKLLMILYVESRSQGRLHVCRIKCPQVVGMVRLKGVRRQREPLGWNAWWLEYRAWERGLDIVGIEVE